MDLGRLNLLAMEIENDPVGLGCHYFTISYGLLMSVIVDTKMNVSVFIMDYK